MSTLLFKILAVASCLLFLSINIVLASSEGILTFKINQVEERKVENAIMQFTKYIPKSDNDGSLDQTKDFLTSLTSTSKNGDGKDHSTPLEQLFGVQYYAVNKTKNNHHVEEFTISGILS